MAYTGENEPDRAIEDCDSALRIEPDDPAGLTNRCAALINKDLWSRATADCDAALRLDPNHAMPLASRGLAYLCLGRAGPGDRWPEPSYRA